ncbi:PH domain-containing protein [Natronoglomus mannanivorans]|uniref:PH domain-containing protein n=1 Tax=Natronoglomus mannanivorans TaxID=2979990 RepID=UPI00308337D7
MTQSQTYNETDVTDTNASEADDEQVLHQISPAIKPLLVWLGLTIIGGGVLGIAFFVNLFGLEDAGLGLIVGSAIVFLTGVIAIKLLIKMYVLRRTTYTLTDDAIRYEFSLWFNQRSRELPYAKIRGVDLSQDRIQRLYQIGTVSVLTGGTNASLGYIECSNVPNPERVRTIVRNQMCSHSTDSQ